mgnify:CR=1 FL=1
MNEKYKKNKKNYFIITGGTGTDVKQDPYIILKEVLRGYGTKKLEELDVGGLF